LAKIKSRVIALAARLEINSKKLEIKAHLFNENTDTHSCTYQKKKITAEK